jgi:hypothetical protein
VEFYLVEDDTGAALTYGHVTADANSRSLDVDFIVDGTTQGTLSVTHSGTITPQVIMYQVVDEVYFTVIIPGDATYRRSFARTGTDSQRVVIKTGTLPGSGTYRCSPDRLTTSHILDAFGPSTPVTAACTGSAATMGITFDDIAGECGTGGTDWLSEINNTTFSVAFSSSTAQSLSANLTCGPTKAVVRVLLARRGVSDGSTTSYTLYVSLQIRRAWVIFSEDYGSLPACTALDIASMALLRYHNADGIDFSAATCEVDST